MKIKHKKSEVGDSLHYLERGYSEINEVDEMNSETKIVDA